MTKLLKLIMAFMLIFLALGCITSEDDITEDISDEKLEQLREADEQAALAHAAARQEDAQTETNIDNADTSDDDSSLVKDYKIIVSEDDNWMDAIRKQYWILVPSDISEAEVKATLMQVVMDETSKNHDIDAICIFAYDRKVDVGYAYTIGTVDWCPNGNWNVPSEIAKSNDRSSYEYVFNIAKRVVNPTVTKPTEFDYEIYEYFKISYDAAWDKIDLSDPYAIVDEDLVMQDVAKHYGVTAKEAEASYMKVVEHQYPTLTDDEVEEFEYLLDAMNWDNVLLDQDMEALNSPITESKSQDILTTIELTQYDIECSKITVTRLRTFLETHGEILERSGQDVNAILASLDKTDEKIKNVEHEIGK